MSRAESSDADASVAPTDTAQIAIDVRLLGSFELRDAAGQPVRLSTRKAEALLALLALHAGQPQAREKLCGLLWPEVREAQARHSLRQTLLQLRKALASDAPALWSDARGLQLTAANVRSDLAALERALELGTREGLHEASQHYRGDLLEGLSVGEAPFDGWLQVERKRVRARMTEGLSQLLALEIQGQRDADALQICMRLLALDPLREEAHRSLMRLLMRQGRRAAALDHYRTFAASLRSQLGSEPDPLTQQLFAQLESAPAMLVATSAEPPAVGSPETAGRSRELALLFEALRAARDARARVALLAGEAGVGKTHLCDCLAQTAQTLGFRVLRARCFESEQVLPLSLWANLLRDEKTPALSLPREQRAELATLIPELTPDEPARASDARRLFHAVHELVVRMADSAPLLLLLEDMHWADEMSARLLSYLGRHQRQARCLLLISVREEELPAGSFMAAALGELAREQLLTRVELAPLSHTETHELAGRLATRHELPPLEAALSEQIWAISQGNPLVIVESMRALASGTLARDVTQLPVPERVRTLILNRVAKVSTGAREVLAVAAVAGRELELDVLTTALDGLPLTAALDELARVQLVRAVEERVYFTHDRIRETLYSEMLPVSRRLLHGRVAKALEQRELKLPATIGHIGYHYSKAGDAPQAVRYLTRFAELAFRDHGVNEALVALEQAFEDAARLPDAERNRALIEIVIRQSYCFISLSRMEELIARMRTLAPALLALNSAELSGPFHFFWGFALALTAERREAEAHAQRALDYAVRCDDKRVIGFTNALLSYLCQMTGRFQEGIAHGLLAIELIGARSDTREAATIAWLCLGMNHLWLGEVQAAHKAVKRGAEIAHDADNLRGQALSATTQGLLYGCTDEWKLALEATERGLKASREPFTFVSGLWMTAWAQSGNGQYAQAIELLTQVISLFEERGLRAWSAHAMAILSDALRKNGDAERAVAQAQEALDVALATDDRACAGWALRAQCLALGALGQHEAARAASDRAIALFVELHAPLERAKALLERAELELTAQAPERALRDLQQAEQLFKATDVVAPLTRVAQLRAALDAQHGQLQANPEP
jgi:DNA-binding SARP family transcriptional activator